MFFCSFVRLSPFVGPSVRPSVPPSIRPSVRRSVRPSVRPSVPPSVGPTVRLAVRPTFRTARDKVPSGHSYVRLEPTTTTDSFTDALADISSIRLPSSSWRNPSVTNAGTVPCSPSAPPSPSAAVICRAFARAVAGGRTNGAIYTVVEISSPLNRRL